MTPTAQTSPAARLLRPIDQCHVQALLTDTLQVSEILEWILAQTGPAHVRQSTFSISEEFIRRLHSLRESGLVKSMSLIIDFKASKKTVNLWLFISQVVDSCHLAENHSKVILINADSGRKVTVITSQNLTRGNRNESSCIILGDEIYDSIAAQMDNIIKTKSIPLDDILTQDE